MAQLNGTLNANTTCADFTPFLNYVAIKTTGLVDSYQTDVATRSCASYTCLLLHNGAVIHFDPTVSFGATDSLRLIWWGVDPDGKVTGGNQGKSLFLYQYYDGKLRSIGGIIPGSQEVGYTYPGPCESCEPNWFSWN
ncbi:MAG: hypothetical protein VKJ04_11790 [Vampirovibrionales bacterium]|nr:hypothetical protein [Vampirovibrionales bacterium]